MKRFFDFLFSIQLSGTLLLIFAFVTGAATFIENDLGTLAARFLVYEACWFELLIALMAVNILGGIFKYKLYKRKKYTVLLFHISFVIILSGAAITRYTSYEGNMSIREGQKSNQIISEHSYLQLLIKQQGKEYRFEEKKMFSTFKQNSFDKRIEFAGQQCRLSFVEFFQAAAETIVEDPGGSPIISFVTVGKNGRENLFLRQGESIIIGGKILSFESDKEENVVNIRTKNEQLFFTSPTPGFITSMADGKASKLESNKKHTFSPMTLYRFGNTQIVIKKFYPKALIKLVSAPNPDPKQNYSNAVVMKLEFNGQAKELTLFGGKGFISERQKTKIDGTAFELKYGSKQMEIPFYLYLRDFQLDRYPGSRSPSSFTSEVTVIDERNNLRQDRRIFMNNVLNYDGYRFFQSSYDQDEKGTILSVNHDYWGTFVTYIGYFLMTLGMFLNFFRRNSRFRTLMRSAKTATLITLLVGLGLLFPQTSRSQTQTSRIQVVDKDHAKAFGKLLLIDPKGRVKPINTLSAEILRKITKRSEFMGQNPDQVLLGILSNPGAWQDVKMIKVSDKELRNILGITGRYASFSDFIIKQSGSYKLAGYIDRAYKKKPAERNGFDKEIIKVDERVNIWYMAYTGDFLKIFPFEDENSWLTANEYQRFDSTDAVFVQNILPLYYGAVKKAQQTGNWSEAWQYLNYIKTFQQKFGSKVFPSGFKIKLEILYNQTNIFKRLFPYFLCIGFIMLMLCFINILNPKRRFSIAINAGIILIILGFVFQSIGLAARWYIAGHAPWSDGYETMILIAWGAVLAGLLFTKRSKITLSVAIILAGIVLMVANMSWMDPEITNLVPVLKSYWLVIHVAVIVVSYVFLALGALLGFLNLILMNLKNSKNKTRLDETIRELSNINEMNLIIGSFLITVGTFLGAVWANESWGRYWGWDPKETWALITVIVYAFVIHMRLIPGLKGRFAFNFVALISFASVLMTYFGVNYYLSGMHSYAKGDPVPVPNVVWYTLIIIAGTSLMGYINERKIREKHEV